MAPSSRSPSCLWACGFHTPEHHPPCTRSPPLGPRPLQQSRVPVASSLMTCPRASLMKTSFLNPRPGVGAQSFLLFGAQALASLGDSHEMSPPGAGLLEAMAQPAHPSVMCQWESTFRPPRGPRPLTQYQLISISPCSLTPLSAIVCNWIPAHHPCPGLLLCMHPYPPTPPPPELRDPVSRPQTYSSRHEKTNTHKQKNLNRHRHAHTEPDNSTHTAHTIHTEKQATMNLKTDQETMNGSTVHTARCTHPGVQHRRDSAHAWGTPAAHKHSA